MVSALTVKL